MRFGQVFSLLVEKAARFLGLCGCLLIAASLTGEPGVTSSPPAGIQVFGALLTCGVGVVLLAGKPLALRSAVALTLGLLFLLTGFLGGLSSLDVFLSQVGLASWIAGLGLLASFLIGIRDREDWRRTAQLVVAFSVFSTAYGLIVALNQGTVLRSNFTNPDCFSVIPLTGSLLALGLLPAAPKKGKVALTVCIFTLSVGILLTVSRSGCLGFIAGLTTFALMTRKKERARQALLVTLVAPALAALLLLNLGKGQQVTDKWTSLAVGKEGLSIQVRLSIVKGSLRALQLRPALGYGPSVFHLAFQSFRPTRDRSEDYMNVAHNDFIQVLVEFGITGGLLWAILLLWCIYSAIKSCSLLNSLEHAGAVGAVAGILVYSLGNFAIPVLTDLLFLFAALGLCVASKNGQDCTKIWRVGLGAVLLLAGLVGCRLAMITWNNNHLLTDSVVLEDGLKWEEAYDALGAAEHTGDLRVLIERARLAERIGLFQGAALWIERAVGDLELAHQLCPVDLRVLLRLAGLYESQGKFKEALQMLQAAQEQSTQDKVVERSIVRNLILQGNVSGAAQQLLTTNPEEDPMALGELLVILELQKKGEGVSLLHKWSSGKDDRSLVEAARHAGSSALGLKHPDIALTFFNEVLRIIPNDADALLACVPLRESVKDKISLARKASSTATDDAVREKAMTEWVSLVLSQKAPLSLPAQSELTSKMEVYLAKFPGSTDLRTKLSEIYESESRIAEARRVLRDGLDQDPSGVIHVHLGALYERNGSPDIAINYYEEALKLQPANESLRALINKLQGPKVNFEDPTKLRSRRPSTESEQHE